METVVNETFLGQTQGRIAQKFLRLEIKFMFSNKSYLTTILRDL